MESFGELRSLAQAPPSATAWTRLCAFINMLDPTSHEIREVWLPYVQQALTRWDPWLRVVPMRWVYDLLADRAPPWIALCRRLILMGDRLGRDAVEALSRSEAVSALEIVEIHAEMGKTMLPKLARNPALENVTSLRLTRVALGGQRQARLVATPLFQGIKRLSWRWAELDALDLADLLHSPGLSQLAMLNLTGSSFDEAHAHALASPDMPQTLRALDLSRTTWRTQAALTRMGQAPMLARLSALNLDEQALPDPYAPALELLLAPLSSGPLTRLSLRRARVDEHAPCPVDALLRHAPASLSALDLHNNRLDAPALSQLSQHSAMSSLTQLELRSNDLGRVAPGALASCARLPQLRALGLWNNALGSQDGIVDLAKSPLLAQVQHLNLRRNFLGDHGLRALLDAEVDLSALETLDLQLNSLSAASLSALQRTDKLPNLRDLYLNDTTLQLDDSAAIAALGDALRASPWLRDDLRLRLDSPNEEDERVDLWSQQPAD